VSLTENIKEKAYSLGFDLIGVAPASRAPHADAYASWVDAGYAATMGYMARDVARRGDPRRVLPSARSVIVVGLSYFVADPPAELWDDPSRGRIARYAWGSDYHEVMTPRLGQLADFISQQTRREVGQRDLSRMLDKPGATPQGGFALHLGKCVAPKTGDAPGQRIYVDTGPVLERDFAAQAGLGFIGKNTCLINPGMGSYLFLGEILVDLELDFDEPAGDSGATITVSPGREGGRPRVGTCGACTRCLKACPTHAFPRPHVLDSNRCISYLTIELKGSIPPDLRPLMGNWIFGCDECQAVCPWPRRFARPTRAGFVHFDAEQVAPKLLDIFALDEPGFRSRFRHTPLWRAKRRGLLRNVAVALGNWADPQAIPALERALHDPEPLICEHAAWALARMR
jgi:epoxyqueuosine reductase